MAACADAALEPSREDGPPNPVPVPGPIKLAGERPAVQSFQHLLEHTSWRLG